MSAEEDFDQEDQLALEFCLRVLQEDPRLPYKEARREARGRHKVGLRRQVWTFARRKLGLAIDQADAGQDDAAPRGEETGPSDADALAQPMAPPARRPIEPRREEEPPRARPVEPPMRAPEPPAWRPDRPRPAWATPREALRPREEADPLVAPRPSFPAPPARPALPPAFPPAYPQARPPHPPLSRGYDAPLSPRVPDTPPLPPRIPPRDPDAPPPAMLTPESNPNSAIEWMVEYLRTVHRDASFQEVRRAAETVGHTVFPSTFGRAQAIVGLHGDAIGTATVRAPIPPRPPVTPPAVPPARPPVAAPVAPVAPAAPAPVQAPVTQRPQAPAAAPAQPVERHHHATGKRALPLDADEAVRGLALFQRALEKAEADHAVFVRAMQAMLAAVESALDDPA